MPRTNKIADDVHKTLKKPIQPKKKHNGVLIPTGSSLLNLACSDDINGGFMVGRMVNIIGDSDAGKSFLAFTVFAEAAKRKDLKDYRFIYDDAENASSFDVEYLFGQDVVDRVESPGPDGKCSETIEEFDCFLDDVFKEGRPAIYILDSFDAISTEQDQDKMDEFREAKRKGKEVSGTYGMAKPKKASAMFANVCAKLRKHNVLLIIISQTRDNISPMSFSPKTRSGGKALKFYSTHEMWLACAKTHEKKEIPVGADVVVKVSKNKLTGKKRKVKFSLFYDYGVDDIASMVDYLIAFGEWTKNGTNIVCKGLGDFTGNRAKIIRHIENEGLEDELKAIVSQTWERNEEVLKLNRKRKYT